MIKMAKRASALLLGTVIIGGAMIPMEAEAVQLDNCGLVDDADLLTEEEKDALNEQIVETAESIDMNILVFVSGTYVPEYDTQMYCESLCNTLYGLDDDSVVFYMDLSGHDDLSYSPYDFIYTRNLARFYYTDGENNGSDRIQEIFDEINPYLPRGNEDIPGAVEEFLGQLEWHYDLGPDYDYYYYVPDSAQYVTLDSDENQVFSDSAPKKWGLAILIGMIASLIISLITFFCIKSHYRFKSAPSSLHYLSCENARLGPPSDVFIRKYQTRHKIERSSSGGGRSGGGGGTRSGGGGGGNHR